MRPTFVLLSEIIGELLGGRASAMRVHMVVQA